MRKCAPSQGSPNGKVTVAGSATPRRCVPAATRAALHATSEPPYTITRPAEVRPMNTASTASASRRATATRIVAMLMTGSTLETDAAAAARALRAFRDEFDASGIQRADQLHERIDVAANDAVACLHPLNRGQRKAGHLGQFALVDTEKGARRPQLCRRDDLLAPCI